jgi:hypothetical protein
MVRKEWWNAWWECWVIWITVSIFWMQWWNLWWHKVKLSLHFNWAPRHEGGLGESFFDLGTRWRWVVSLTPQPLYPQGKNPWYTLDRRLGGSQSRSGCRGEGKIPSPRQGPNPRTPIVQPVAQWAIMALNFWWYSIRIHMFKFRSLCKFSWITYSKLQWTVRRIKVSFRQTWNTLKFIRKVLWLTSLLIFRMELYFLEEKKSEENL